MQLQLATIVLRIKSNEDSDSGSEGLYEVKYKLHTPFQFLDHFYLDFNLQSQEESYETDMYLDLKDVRVGVNASIDICNEGNYFFTQTEISISSPVLMLPILNISITKDFNEVENKVIATLDYRYGTEIKYAAVNSYAVLGSWHFSSNKLLKLSGHLLTPFPKFDELKAHLYYSCDDIQQLYSVESSFKYSSDFVIITRGNVYGSNIYLFIESTIENFRLLEVNGTLLQQGGGYYSIEPVFSRNSVPTMQGRMTMSEDVPLHLHLNIYDENKKQIAGLSMEMRKKISNALEGFNIFLVIRCKNISILNLESNVSMSPENVNTYQVIARSEIPGYNKINFTLSLLPPENSLSIVKLDGCSDLKFLSTDFNVICTYWLGKKEGFLKTDLKSNISTASSYISWTFDYPHSMRGFANATYKYQGTTKGFSSQLFFISPNAGLDNIFAGADFSNLNKNWWFNSNVSLLAPSLSNIGFTSHLRVPQTHNIHTLVGKLYYTQDLKVLDQMLEYSTKTPNAGFKTVGKVNITDDSFDSEILLMTGENRSMFLHDIISARRKELSYEVVNIFKSSFIQDELTLKLLYERPLVNHILRVNMFYPQTIPVVKAFVHYETMNNLLAFLNCTVPFSDVPKISAQIGAVTNFRKYQRQGQLQWHNRTALFNYTHFISKISNEAENIHSNITDGVLIVDFPLATRHVGKVVYTYEDYEKFSSGYSKMVYNQEEILNGNFTYRTEATDSSKENDISIYINNSYIPLGFKYFSNLSKGIGKSGTSSERKKCELFRLNNSTALNISGELIIDKFLFEDRIKLIIHHANANRTLNIDTVKTPNKTLQALANLHLKPNMWFNSKFVISTNDTEYAFGKNVMFSLSYPNREFIVQGTYLKPSDRLAIEIEICPNNLLKEKHTIGGTFTWIHSLDDMDYHKALVLISHPSFEKNVTLIGELKLKDWVLLNLNSSLEYAKEEEKKVTLSGMFKHNQSQPGKDYSLQLYANHDASSLNLDLNSYLKYRHLFFNFKKDLKYTRSYLPLQFWISMLNLDGIDHVFELETHSLRELIRVHADYVKEGPFHKINSSAIKGSNNKISGKFYLNLDDMDSRLLVNLTPDALEQLHMQAKYTDNRHVFFQIWRIYEEVFLSDVLLDAKLNHSRLLFGTLAWRPQLKQEVTVAFHSSVAFIWSYIKESTEFWTEYVKSETIESVNDIWSDAKPMLKDFLDDVKNVDKFKEDIEYFRKILNESYNANEFYMQDVYNIYLLMAEEIAFKDKMSSLPKIVNELWNTLGETGETIRQSIIWLTETIQRMYDKLLNFFSGFLNGETSQQLSQSFSSFIESYDKFIKDLHVSFIDYMESLWDHSANIISNYWKTAIQVIEPTFIELVHYIDTVFWTGSKKILNFMYQKQNQIMNTPFFMRESNISQDLDKFYKDLTKRDFFSNLSKYTSMILGIIKDKYFKVVPFGYELKEVVSEIYNDIKVLYKLPAISFTIETSHSVYLKLLWFLEFFQIGDKIQKSIPFLYHQLTEVSHDAIENDMKNRESKTKFIFDIRSGFIHLTQKLPIPWHSFNDTPNFKEIPEYKMLTRVQSWFETSNLTWQHFYYKFAYLRDFNNWIPPFRGQAYIIGDKHFITFDKKFKTYEGPCSYLLAKDFVNNNFALILKSNGDIANHHSIVLLVRGNSIEIDHINKKLKVQDLPMNLPFNLNGTYLFWENDIITVERKEEFILTCNLKYAICCFDIVGWYFGKTAGLLGTMDNEPTTDALSSHGEEEGNTSIFMKSWSLDTESCPKFSSDKGYQVSTYDNLYEKCNHLFVYKSSPFNYCFDVVNPEPYKELCYMKKQDRNEMCTAAVTYVQSCHLLNVPLRIPYYCVNCSLQNGSYFQEGKFIEIKSDVGSYSTDIVFIIEAKECNKEISEKRHLPVFLSILTKELQLLGIENSRFALVTFGGDGLFNRPNNILMDNHAFADSKIFLDALKNIEIGNGDGDIFAAIKYASKMQFRIGASTVFILLPCSSCDISNQTVDFSVLDDVLIERSISLHVLMNKDFGFGKAKMIKNFFGFDSEAAYTKNDLKHFKGNKALLKHVKVRKSLFGYCTPLALNTNGSLFTAKKMENSSLTSVKKFLGVFAKRVAKSSVPQTCQMCECSADDYGIDFIECYPCDAPHPSLADIGYSSRFNLLQSLDESNNSELNISL
uniref:VWFD domain-containing protein n=1 Tax=Clastoptera arizonana TaxID=38151 RepID=A0A1B6DM97_9HEMI